MWVAMGLCITYLPCATGSEAYRFLQDEKGGREPEPVSRAMPAASELLEGSREGPTQSPEPAACNNKATNLQLPSISRQP